MFTGIFVVSILGYILSDIFIVSSQNFSLDFIYEEPFSSGRKGGIFPIIASTVLLLGICLWIVVPVGLATAVYLSSSNGLSAARKSVEILSAVPSIVFGLFGNAFFSVYLGLGFSILSGGFTLALMSLPLFITTVEKGLSSVPKKFRLVGHSLGLSKLTLMRKVVVPLAFPYVVAGVVLSVGRSLAETAALIFTAGYVDRMPTSVLDSGRALSVHIYDLTMNVPGGDINAYKTSFVLIFLILTINSMFNVLLKLWYQKRVLL